MGRARWRVSAWLMVLAGAVCALFARTVPAQQLNRNEVPPELRAWVDWVLPVESDAGCRKVGELTVCSWPGSLSMEFGQTSASFELSGWSSTDSDLKLPGSQDYWPEDVKLGANPALVLDQGGLPFVRVKAGNFSLRGRFAYAERPDSFEIPEQTAYLKLTVGSQEVPFPDRNKGTLRIEAPAQEEPELPAPVEPGQESAAPELSLQVARRIDDGVPVMVTTHLMIRVAGPPREVNLGNIMPAGVVPLTLESSLPLQLDKEGGLLVRVRAGTHLAVVVGRAALPPAELSPPALPDPWPKDEIWVWKESSELRDVALSGAPKIDPSRTDVPNEWKSLTGFKLRAGDKLKFETKRRGVTRAPPNELKLSRALWLDSDGQTWSVQDTITGKVQRNWRLDLLKGDLGRVDVAREGQLITKLGEHGGVELRSTNLNMLAEWRTPAGSGELPVSGWSEDFDTVSTSLNLPPGYQLLAATGTDELSPTWLDYWDLAALLTVIALSLAIGRLLGWPWAALAVVGLSISHAEVRVSYTLWLVAMGFLFVLGLVSRRAPRFRLLAQVACGVAGLVLALNVAEFAAQQVRSAVYPHTARIEFAEREYEEAEAEQVDDSADNKEGGTGTRAKGEEGSMGNAKSSNKRYAVRGPSDNRDPYQARQQALREAQQFGMIGLLNAGAGGDPGAPKPKLADQEEVLQTGDGIPRWDYYRWDMSWSGPIKPDQTVKLWLVPPWATRSLSVLRALLLSLLVLGMIRHIWRRVRPAEEKPPAPPANRAAAAAALLLGLSAVCWAHPAAAQTPSAELLEQLKEKLTAERPLAPTPTCDPNCVSVSRLIGSVSGTTLILSAEVHAAGPSTYQLPGPAQSWVPAEVKVDGKPSRALALMDDGSLHLRLEAGRHQVELSGKIAGNSLTLDPGNKPKRMTFRAEDGWQISGVDDNGRVSGSLQLNRSGADVETADTEPTTGKASPGSDNIPSWLSVKRVVTFGLVWTVRTDVTRASSGASPLQISIPLLPGEKVTTPDVKVVGNGVLATLGAYDSSSGLKPTSTMFWEGVIKPGDALALSAPKDSPWTEEWVTRCAEIWRCRFDGVTPIAHTTDDRWAQRYKPWPGESLKVALDRPPPAPGKSVTIDSATLRVTPDKRLTSVSLGIVVRSSSIDTQVIELPEGAVIKKLTVGMDNRDVPKSGSKVEVALQPGVQDIGVSWEQKEPLGLVTRSPEVKLGRQAVNAITELRVPEERWLVFTSGPGRGPVILLWGYIALLALGGYLLSRLPRSPLRGYEFALIAVGFCCVPFRIMLPVVAWFFALAAREQLKTEKRWLHNVVQVALVLLTIAAAYILLGTAYETLMRRPRMMLVEHGGYGDGYSWYVDRIAGEMPRPWLVTAPEWLWQAIWLGWALWLAWSFRKWGPWAWSAFGSGGVWRRRLAPAAAGSVASASTSGVPGEEAGREATPAAAPPATAEATNDDGDSGEKANNGDGADSKVSAALEETADGVAAADDSDDSTDEQR